MEPGDKVRIRANPSKVGTLGRATDGPPTRLKVLVTWSDGEEQFVLKSSLEAVDQAPQGPYEMIRVGSFGRAGDLRGAITHYRLTGKLANLIYSLETTNTKFLPYQFKPVLQFLDSPCNGILIADEVGLGKTIEAGLIWTELRARQDARRLLVVCPAMLRDKWRRELNDRFGVRAEIVDADGVLQKLVELKERPNMGFALIASLQGLRPSRRWNDADEPAQSASAKLARLLDEQQGEDPVFDLTIVDEAHYLRNEGTQTHKLGQLLRPCTQSLVLLSATPVQLHSRDLFNLVNLLDEDAFPFESSFAQTLQANAPVLALRDRVRREPIAQDELRAELGAVMEHWAFDGNQQLEYLRDNIPAPEALARPEVRAELADRLDRINPLAKVITRTMKRDVDGERPERKPHVIRAEMSKIEAQFYDQVTNAIREYCSRRSVSEGFMLTIPQRQMSSCMAAACMGWDARASQEEIEETLYEAFGDDPENEDPIDTAGIGSLSAELMRIARSIGNTQQLRLHDTKYAIFVKQLKEYWAANPGKKIVLFAFYRKTLDYLHERLSQDDIHAVLLYGGMEKELVLRDFERREGASILLSSEVASEGVDLQFSSLLVNYDLPWNPARIEQRVGRIDRIGQDERQILIWNLLYKDTLDERVHDRLLTRLNIFQQALGVTEAVLGQEIQALSRELLTHKLTPEQEQSRIDRAAMALENSKQQEARLENEAATLIAHGEFIQNKVKAAKELGRYIQGEDLTAYIRDGLERTYPGTRLISVSSDDIQQRLELSTEARSDISDFLQKHRLQGRTAVLSAMPPILLFENKLGRTAPQIERVTQDHPLVRFVSDRLRMSPGGLGYCPVSAIELAGGAIDGLNPGIYVYAVSRWSVSGARDLERLEYVVRPLNEHYFLDPDAAEQLVNTAALRGSDWLGVAAKVDTHNAATLQDLCSQEIERRFEEFKAAEQRANADRVRLMVSSLERHLANKERRSEELIQAHRISGSRKRMGLINAERAKVQKERIRIEGRIAELRLREQITAHESAVSSGLIRAR